MAQILSDPGVLLVLLARDKTSTRVLVFDGEDGREPLPWAPAQPESTQWGLAEALCDAVWSVEVSRLYASALGLEFAGHRLGIFVGFLDGAARDAPPPPHASWQDLRRSADALPAAWGAALADVRAAFVARSPDESMRVR